MSNRNPKGKSLTPRQEAALAKYEDSRMRARIIELGVARFLNDDSGYRQGVEACASMLQEALKLRHEADAMLRQFDIDTMTTRSHSRR